MIGSRQDGITLTRSTVHDLAEAVNQAVELLVLAKCDHRSLADHGAKFNDFVAIAVIIKPAVNHLKTFTRQLKTSRLRILLGVGRSAMSREVGPPYRILQQACDAFQLVQILGCILVVVCR